MRRWSRWLRYAIYLLCAAAFIADLTNSVALAFGVFYLPLVSTAVFHRDQRAPWYLAAIACVLVIVGYFYPPVTADMTVNFANRALSIAAILVTAYLVQLERQIRQELANQTTRADIADRMRSQLFNNLSHELRTPLSAILGFADFLLRDARGDQRAPLEHIRAGGKRLLATLDNLIDLTQISGRTMRPRPVDLVAVLTNSVEDSRLLANEKSITLTLMRPQTDIRRVVADGWALRRIIDNLIGNAIKFSGAGSVVEVLAQSTDEGIAAIVRDNGPGMPPDVLEQLGEPFFQADSGTARRFEGMGAGLALSLRLADAMGAALHFDSTPNQGTTASLVLPVDGSA